MTSARFEVRHVEASVRGRLLVRAAPTAETAPLLAGFHGYAQSAEENLEALLGLPGIDSWHVAAVQGLHRFYRNRDGEIGASWMTRQDREMAIEDNVRYVGAALARLKEELAVAGPLVLVGFSQGTAMAYRAAAGSGHRVDGLVALAGDVPAEIVERPLAGFPRVLIGRGTEDEWYTEATMKRDLELLGGAGIEVETCVFPGGHEWTAELYEAAGEFLESLVGDG